MRHRAHFHKWILLVSIIFTFFILPMPIFALDFPEWKDGVIQDESETLPLDQLELLNAKLNYIPHPTKVFIFQELDIELSDFLEQAFTYYELPDDQLLFVFVNGSGQMAASAGVVLDELGITKDVLYNHMINDFKPIAKTGDILGGLEQLLLTLYEESPLETSAPVNEEPIREELEQSEQVSQPPTTDQNEKKGFSIWMYLLFAIIILVLAFAVIIFLRKKQLDQQINSMEVRKNELVAKWSEVNLQFDVSAIPEEVLLRFTNLENTYEDYRYRIFPDLEDDFKDVRNLAGRFRVGAAKEILHYIVNTLNDADFLLQQLKNEIQQFSVVKKEAPKSLEYLKKSIALLQIRVEEVGNQYGIALQHIRETIKNCEKEYMKFKFAIEEKSSINPNDLQRLTQQLQKIEQDLKQIDQTSEEMEEKIPTRLKELENKFKRVELEDEAALVQILKEAREKWNSLITLWDEGKIDQLTQAVRQINERLLEGERMIEQEYNQNQAIMRNIEHFEKRMREITSVYQNDRIQFEKLHRKYQLEEDPVADLLNRIDEIEKELERTYQIIQKKLEKREYKEAFQIANPLPNQIDQFAELVAQFHTRVDSLSTEEERYSAEVKSLRNRLRIVRQQLDRSLLPGKQDQILEMIDQSFTAILETEVLFDQLPLRLNKISLQLRQAHDLVETVEQLTKTMIENAHETEEIIRRINIYRTSVPQIAQFLMMAENAYRDQKFDEAVSYARKAESMLENYKK